MNPFNYLMQLQPRVKMTIVICLTLVLIASMGFGYFDEIIEVFK